MDYQKEILYKKKFLQSKQSIRQGKVEKNFTLLTGSSNILTSNFTSQSDIKVNIKIIQNV